MMNVLPTRPIIRRRGRRLAPWGYVAVSSNAGNPWYNIGMARTLQPQQLRTPRQIGAEVGTPENALKFSVNLSADVGSELKRSAFEHRVSESSVIEVALRQLFRRVSAERLGPFLRQNGACLRRRS